MTESGGFKPDFLDMNEHLTAQRIQAFLDDQLAESERADVREHVVFCARCQAELEGWQILYAELGDLTEIEPSPAFAGHVLERFPELEPVPSFGERARAWLAVGRRRAAEHLSPERVQDYVDGVLPARPAARIEAHLEGCRTCRAEVTEWQDVFEGLRALESWEPTEGFYERVLAQHRVMQLLQAWEPVPARVGAFSWTKRLVPRTRRAWAALAGLATAPASILVVLLVEMFSNPALTPGYLGSFVSWKLADLGSAFAATAVESPAALQAYALVDFVASSPILAALGAIGFGLLSVSATWVLYSNLFRRPGTDHAYVQASA